jgi:hypothetical protein
MNENNSNLNESNEQNENSNLENYNIDSFKYQNDKKDDYNSTLDNHYNKDYNKDYNKKEFIFSDLLADFDTNVNSSLISIASIWLFLSFTFFNLFF